MYLFSTNQACTLKGNKFIFKIYVKRRHNILLPANEVWGKVIFLYLSVSHSVHKEVYTPDTPRQTTPGRRLLCSEMRNESSVPYPKFGIYQKSLRATSPPGANKAAHSGFETQRRCHQKSEIWVSVAPQKGHVSSKN